MPYIENGSNWPSLLKQSDEFRHLFPATIERDTELEDILSRCVQPKNAEHNAADLVEASRRLREAVQHDAYLRWTPADREALAEVFSALEIADAAIGALTTHQHKAILTTSVSIQNSNLNLDELRQQISVLLFHRETISQKIEEADSIRTTTARTATEQISMIQRLIEAWTVLSGQKPGTSYSNNDVDPGQFESCLQQVADHLDLPSYNKNRPFIARSVLQAYGKNPPPPDNLD